MRTKHDRETKQQALTRYEATVGLLERRAHRNTEQLPTTTRAVCTDPDKAFGQ
jgi:hypothetical protein